MSTPGVGKGYVSATLLYDLHHHEKKGSTGVLRIGDEQYGHPHVVLDEAIDRAILPDADFQLFGRPDERRFR
jgi:hypothetical protein